MADITAADVTYEILPYPKGSLLTDKPPRYSNLVSVTFGDGALTYPTGGIPVSGIGLGFPEDQVEYIIVITQDVTQLSSNSTFWQYNTTSNTLVGVDVGGVGEISGAVPATSLTVLARGY